LKIITSSGLSSAYSIVLLPICKKFLITAHSHHRKPSHQEQVASEWMTFLSSAATIRRFEFIAMHRWTRSSGNVIEKMFLRFRSARQEEAGD
jgi:hypothetical protein